jgi:preprotein translocase subunit SecD
MLFTPLWKRILIWGVVALGIAGAVPNLFYTDVEKHNDALVALEAVSAQNADLTTAEATARLTPEQQADKALWPGFLPSALVNLGLDLRGGAHLLAEVQVEDVYKTRMDAYWPRIRDALRDVRDEVGAVRRQPSPDGILRVRIENPAGLQTAIAAIEALATPVVTLTGAGSSDIEVTVEGSELVVQLSEAEREATDDRTLQQSLEIIRRRVDEVGTREPTIQRQGEDRVLIQVPGIGSAAELKSLIGQTAQLTFNRVLSRTNDAATPVGIGEALLPSRDEPGAYYVVETTPVVSGEDLTDAQPAFDTNNAPAVNFRFNSSAAQVFGDYTAANIGQPFAIVLDEEVISAPTIQSHIPGGSGIITGRFSLEESTELAVLLRAGALPAELTFLEERTVGPELGQDSIDAGKMAAMIAMLAVVLYMWASYGLFGIFANIALAANMALIFAALSAVGGTLTLPGIAGIVLTIGMAVDANVLVFERIREELRTQKSPARAIEIGYEKALSAIIDANITTFITAVVLWAVGAGPVRGFAITLGIGIITSVFTALFVTRLLVELWFNWRKPKTVYV